jgi:hypothetical protein
MGDAYCRVSKRIRNEEFIYTPPPRVGTVPNASSSGPVGDAAFFLDWFKLQARDLLGTQVGYTSQGIF